MHMNWRHIAFLFLASVFLSACGGGGSSNESGALPTPTNAGGIWIGSSSAGGFTIYIEGVITESGEGRFVDENGTQYIVTSITGNDGQIRINFNAYAQFGYVFLNGSTFGTGTITGTVRERSTFSGNFSFSTGEAGTISFAYDPLYDRDSSLAKISGQWNEGFGVLVVDADGSFFEQDQFGCVYDGRVSIISPNYNAYRLTMNVSNCGSDNGNYQGVGVLADLNVPGDENMFILQMNSNSLIFTTWLERM